MMAKNRCLECLEIIPNNKTYCEECQFIIKAKEHLTELKKTGEKLLGFLLMEVRNSHKLRLKLSKELEGIEYENS